MKSWRAAVLAGAIAVGVGTAAAASQTGSGQTGGTQAQEKQQMSGAKQVTLTGCVRQTNDDPKTFALVAEADADKNKPAGTSGTSRSATADALAGFPLYRLAPKGQSLDTHIGQRVEVTGTVTPAKDEKGVDIVAARSENIGVPTTTITTVDLKPAPRLDITSIKQLSGECTTGARK